MRSKKVTLAIPHRLWDALEKIAPALGYVDARQLVTWSPLYALLVQKPHTFTATVAQASIEVQDAFVEEVVGAFERGVSPKGSYFEALLADIVQRLGVTATAELVQAVVADTVRNRPARKRKG